MRFPDGRNAVSNILFRKIDICIIMLAMDSIEIGDAPPRPGAGSDAGGLAAEVARIHGFRPTGDRENLPALQHR
jgi:hypothetical protein